jgi:TRAP-type uncharacterized transport system substrate-binding protein
MDSKSPGELRFLGPGFNWMKIQGIIAVGMGGYDSPLPKGTTVSATTFDPGQACMEGPRLVAEGKFHTAITTPPWFGRMALEGKGYFSSPLPLRALARFPHFDQLALAVKKETGLNSFGELIEKKYPLRISTAPPNHPAYWVTDQIFQAYGLRFADVERWGGKVTFEERQRGRLDALRTHAIDAVFDEALMTQRWKVITDEIDFTFLSLDEHALRHCEGLGMQRGFIPQRRLRGVERDIPTVDFAGWLLYCREDLPDDYAYHVVRALDENKKMIESLFQPGQGLTGSIVSGELCRDTGIPLHSGAAKYYREKGWL